MSEGTITFSSDLNSQIKINSEKALTWDWLEERGLLGNQKSFDIKSIQSLHKDALKKHQKNLEKTIFTFSKKLAIKDNKSQIDFLDRLSESSYYYYKYAGCVKLDLNNTNEIKEGYISHDTCDFIVLYDNRSKNTTYMIENEYIDVRDSTLKFPQRFGIDYNKPSVPLVINTQILLERYRGLADLSLYWCELDYIRPTDVFENQEACMKAYENEKKHFIKDPYLALYWLVYFGLHFDSKYDEVKDIVLANNLHEELIYINEPLEFFEKVQDIETFKEVVSKKLGEKFLEKLSKDMWLTYLYQYRGGEESYKQWCITLQLYTKVDILLIKRIRWIKNNFLNFNLWHKLNDEYMSIADIPLSSYIQACNPLLKNEEKKEYCKHFINELLEYKEIFISKVSMKFIQKMLYDIRKDIDSNLKEKYIEAVDIYFKNGKLLEEYIAISEDVFDGTNNKNIENLLQEIEKIDSGIDFDKLYSQVESILVNLEDKEVLDLINNSMQLDRKILDTFFKYIYEHNIENKKDLMTDLFFECCYDVEKILFLFKNKEALTFKDEDDVNINIILSWINMTDREFKNRGIRKSRIRDSIENALFFFAFSFHQPFIFKHIEKFISEGLSEEADEALYETFLGSYYINHKEIFPSTLLSQEQHTRLIDTLIERGKRDYDVEKMLIHSAPLSSIGNVINKNNILYIYQLLFEEKLEKFLLPDEVLNYCKSDLIYLHKKIMFEEINDFNLILPMVNEFKYPNLFLKYIEDETEDKNSNFFFWTAQSIDWQYHTYLNILEILKEVLGDAYLQAVPIASHGNVCNIVDIFVFSSDLKTQKYSVLHIKQNKLLKWEIMNSYESFDEFRELVLEG